MKKAGLLIVGLTFVILLNGQTLQIQGGTSVSKLDWKVSGFSVFDETLIGYSIFAGLDYLDKEYFNLSSNIGMIRKGGKANIELFDGSGKSLGQVIEKPTLDYLSINTTVDLKYKLRNTISPFISFGPRLDYLLKSSNDFAKYGIDEEQLKRVAMGLILGGGVKYDISNFQIGVRSDYYWDFTKVVDRAKGNGHGHGGLTVTTNTFAINLTIGYRLK